MSRGQTQRRSEFRRRAFERCRSKGKASDVIDIDHEKNADFIIIIDASESSEWTSLDASTSGKDKTPVYNNIICIDDDDDDDYIGDYGNSNDGFQGVKDDPHLNSSSKCQPFGNQRSELFTMSSCNHRKLSSSTSSENDGSDCYIEEDFQGNIRQQWEEASRRKKMCENLTKCPLGSQDKVGPTRFNVDIQNNVNVDKTAKVGTSKVSRSHENDELNPSVCISETIPGSTSIKSDGKAQQPHSEETDGQEMCKKSSFCSTKEVNETTSKDSANSPSNVELSPLPFGSNGNGLSGGQNIIIGDRELLKKTDAYKRAQEEEWASRQRELQIQAEEAQRLRKRRKAETQRLLETERRQKQRVDEVREAQRKDEETLNLKEQLRIEVRRELDKVESNCGDMASLLRGLGIDTGGGLSPSSSEVRAAYKQALLRFHPDRASRCDIRLQIEAEEKFKLISRAKEKFML